jgi:hypothetical protein
LGELGSLMDSQDMQKVEKYCGSLRQSAQDIQTEIARHNKLESSSRGQVRVGRSIKNMSELGPEEIGNPAQLALLRQAGDFHDFVGSYFNALLQNPRDLQAMEQLNHDLQAQTRSLDETVKGCIKIASPQEAPLELLEQSYEEIEDVFWKSIIGQVLDLKVTKDDASKFLRRTTQEIRGSARITAAGLGFDPKQIIAFENQMSEQVIAHPQFETFCKEIRSVAQSVITCIAEANGLGHIDWKKRKVGGFLMSNPDPQVLTDANMQCVMMQADHLQSEISGFLSSPKKTKDELSEASEKYKTIGEVVSGLIGATVTAILPLPTEQKRGRANEAAPSVAKNHLETGTARQIQSRPTEVHQRKRDK